MEHPSQLPDNSDKPSDSLQLLIDERDPASTGTEEHERDPRRTSRLSRMFWTNYLYPEELRGFKRYKYSAIDTSPLSNYVMHPFWNWLVPYVPRSIAPNTLTLSGFLLIVVNIFIFTWYDPDLKAAEKPSSFIPKWIWWIIAFNHFWAHTLDGLDGKHARRTESSSPLGELFDHGLDSWVTTLHVLSMYSVFGRDGEYGIPTFRMFLALWLMLMLFSLSHWEKYNTGILYLPWGYDFSQVCGLIVYIITGIYGQGFWHFKIPLLNISPGVGFEISLYLGAILLTIPTTLRNVCRAYRNKSLKHNSFPEAMRPLSTIIILLLVTITWAACSPNRILLKEFRMFCWMTGAVCSNITCCLIISQMASTKARWFHWLLLPVFLVFFGVMTVPLLGSQEVLLLNALTIFVTVAHVHYGFGVVRQMADFLNIYAFSIEKPTSPKSSPLQRIDEDVDNGSTGTK